MKSHPPGFRALFLPTRRRVLASMAGLAAVPLTAFAPSTRADADGDICSVAGTLSRRLFVPGAAGYLGRLAPRGTPVTLVATTRGSTAPGAGQGPLVYRVRHAGRDYRNPTLALAPGERVRITLENRLDAPTIAHWHGLAVDTANDGGGLVLVPPGHRYAYDFEVRDRGALYWYHPHPHGSTAQQMYDGLFGLIDVDDSDHAALRRALDLVPGRTELSLVLQDRRHDARYRPAPADLMHGFFGDEAFVNGTPCAYFDVASRLYRLRLLNACNARTLRLAFRTAAGTRLPFTIVGNDAGLLPAPIEVSEAFFAAAERLDLLIDLSAAPVGETILMESIAFDPMHAEMSSDAAAPDAAVDHAAMGHGAGADGAASASRGHQHHAATWPEGGPMRLLAFRVRQKLRYDRKVPAKLASLPPIDTAGARERPFRFGYNKGRWRINDRVFVMGETPVEVARDTTEIWLLRNYHTSMPHAMHLHGFQFEVIERETSPAFVSALAVDERARLASDLGRKDTLLVWPGESVRVAIRFALPWPDAQTYMFHCHNLEHEDGGMMVGVRVA
ncbi:MAG TPA: multicopper oxidase family protein [Casimicrobiaceae bacterium]|nr:multicopper oxidase family protein [Casimicrobiaceae bacterium]